MIIALTGGVGSGKSTVANYFAELGIDVIDADQIAREVVKPGSPALRKITEHFGAEIVNREGELDRRKLRDLIFKNTEQRHWLEQLLHPLIREEMQRRAAEVTSAYCILVIPLLQEILAHSFYDRVLVIDAPKSFQFARTQHRDHVDEADVQAIIKAQYHRDDYLQAADDVITNDGTLDQLKARVLALHQFYLTQ